MGWASADSTNSPTLSSVMVPEMPSLTFELVAGAHQQGVAEEEVFEVEELPALDELAQHGGQADGAGEEHADHGVAGQARAVAHGDDAGAGQDAEADHHRRHPGPELVRRAVP